MKLAALAILASGCASPATEFYVDQRFSVDEEAQIAEAAAAWETATGGAVHVDLVFGIPVIGTRMSRRREIARFTREQAAASEFATVRALDREGDLDGPAVYQPGAESDLIAVVPENLDGWGLATVVAHEFGHTLDLHHVADRDALMSDHPIRAIERFAAEGCLGAADVRELMRVDADMSRARVCETTASVLAGGNP